MSIESSKTLFIIWTNEWMNERTNEQTFAFLELLTEPKILHLKLSILDPYSIFTVILWLCFEFKISEKDFMSSGLFFWFQDTPYTWISSTPVLRKLHLSFVTENVRMLIWWIWAPKSSSFSFFHDSWRLLQAALKVWKDILSNGP